MSYGLLEKTFYRIAQLNHATAMLGWDQQVIMPPKSNEARGRAMAELAVLKAEILQDAALKDAFDSAEEHQQELTNWQRANLREMRNEWLSARAIPTDLVEALSTASNACEHAWRTFRPENNWRDFEPLLAQVFSLTKEKAEALKEVLGEQKGYTTQYDALLDIYDPGIRMHRIDPIFARLKQELPTLVEQAILKQQGHPPPLLQLNKVSKAAQISLARHLMTVLGFDFDAGRLDEAAHPFSGGVSEDTRITSRYDESNLLDGLMAIIHETGHSRYETGLNKQWRHQPVGRAMGMSVHESQSLFFEMQLGRSQPFVDALAPLIQQYVGSDAAFSTHNLYVLNTQVQTSFIRVNADEVTYPLHVILRYELERDIILGKTSVREIPDRWNDAMQQTMGLSTVGDYRNGPMQDIHWPAGAIGYFPSYTLGAMTAAQLYRAMNRDIPRLADQVNSLKLEPLFNWLSQRVWQKGRLLPYDDLMIEATGETLNPDYFLQHLRHRYC